MVNQIYEEMFKNGLHIGHSTHRWNPRMKRFIYGERNGIHLINLESTAEKLEEALAFLKNFISEGKTILFVSTKPQAVHLLEEVANECGMPFVVSKWIPGLLTNFSTLKRRIKYLADLKAQEEAGELDKYTKKELAKIKKDITKLEMALGGVQGMNKRPDAVFVLDVCRDKIAVVEAKCCNMPVIALVDTNADPTIIDYPIPANDDSLTSLTWVLTKVKEVFKSSKAKVKSE